MSDLGAGTEVSPVLQVVQRRIRAAKKKLTRIQELEALQASGKELTPEQLPILKSKETQVLICQELAKVDEGLRVALKEEHLQALSKGEALGREAGAAEAARLLSDVEARHQEALSEALAKSDAEWKAQLDAAVAKATEEATKAAEERHAALLKEPLSPTHPFSSWILGPLRSLLQLFYFSQLFDTWRNYWLAPVEVQACLGYDRQIDTKEGEPHLAEVDLIHLAFFGRTLVDRMTEPLSHEQCLDKAVQAAASWLYDKQAVAIASPPAISNITMGELRAKLDRILASPFCKVKPSVPAASPAGTTFPAEPPLPPGTQPAPHAARPPAPPTPATGPPASLPPPAAAAQQPSGHLPPPQGPAGGIRGVSSSRSDSPAPVPPTSRSPALPTPAPTQPHKFSTGSGYPPDTSKEGDRRGGGGRDSSPAIRGTPGFLDTAPIGPPSSGGVLPGGTHNFKRAGGAPPGVVQPKAAAPGPDTRQVEPEAGGGGAGMLKGLFTLSATGAPVPLVPGHDSLAYQAPGLGRHDDSRLTSATTTSNRTPDNSNNASSNATPVGSLLKQGAGQAWEPSWRSQA